MHILILGASARTGRLVTSNAALRDHRVTVLVRNAESMESVAADNVNVTTGNQTQRSDIAKCFHDKFGKPDAVITTLAAPRASDSPFSKPAVPPFFMRDTIAHLISIMKDEDVSKLVVMSSFGAGNSFPQAPWALKLLLRYTNMAQQFEDHDAVDELVRNSGLTWSLVRPCMLKDMPEKALRTLDEATNELGLFDSCTRENVAGFMLDAAEGVQWEGKAVVLAN